MFKDYIIIHNWPFREVLGSKCSYFHRECSSPTKMLRILASRFQEKMFIGAFLLQSLHGEKASLGANKYTLIKTTKWF